MIVILQMYVYFVISGVYYREVSGSKPDIGRIIKQSAAFNQ